MRLFPSFARLSVFSLFPVRRCLSHSGLRVSAAVDARAGDPLVSHNRGPLSTRYDARPPAFPDAESIRSKDVQRTVHIFPFHIWRLLLAWFFFVAPIPNFVRPITFWPGGSFCVSFARACSRASPFIASDTAAVVAFTVYLKHANSFQVSEILNFSLGTPVFAAVFVVQVRLSSS